jgi:signal transduction histidine kinase
MEKLSLRDRYTLVTGASSGLGHELARQIARDHGGNLVLVARRRDRLDALADELRKSHNVQVACVTADLSKREDTERVFAEATDGRAIHAAVLQRKNADLERANADLVAASELKTMFIRVAGHELRTPLAVQLGLLRLLSRSAHLSEPARDLLARIERAGQRLAQRVEQIMGFLHAGQFARGLDRRPVDLAALVRQSAEEVRPFIERRGQELVIDAPDDLGALPLDAAKIGDCLNQLLLNAIKFTPDGGRIALRARRTDEGGARVEVTDTGRGIPPGEMGHLFTPFFTGFDTARHTSGQFEYGARGLGLGLSLVRAFVELHGGTVSARSEEGHGATFTIDLPGGAVVDEASN